MGGRNTMTERPLGAPLPVLDTALRLSLVAALVAACLWVAAPFLIVLLWSGLLAVMIWPLHVWLRRKRLLTNARSATLIGFAGVSLLAAPLVMLIAAVTGSLLDLAVAWRSGSLALPMPPDWLGSIPVIGTRVIALWNQLGSNFDQLLVAQREPLGKAAAFLGSLAGAGLLSLATAIAAVAIAAIFLAWGDEAAILMRNVFVRVANDPARGHKLLSLSVATIRGVLQGVVGVAAIQAALLGVGFGLAGAPFAGLATIAVLLLGILQLPPLLVTVPLFVWAWQNLDSTAAGIFTAWTLVAGLSDNILKPIMLGRGLDVPMPLILLGVIGGMLADGLLGLFLGPVILALGYVLFHEWLEGPGMPTAS